MRCTFSVRHPVRWGRALRLSILSDPCLPAFLAVCVCLCVLMASTREVWWVFSWCILILKPFEDGQMGDEVSLGRASDGVLGG